MGGQKEDTTYPGDHLSQLQTITHYEYQLQVLAEQLDRDVGHLLANAHQELESAIPLVEKGDDKEVVVDALQSLADEIEAVLQRLKMTLNILTPPEMLGQLSLGDYFSYAEEPLTGFRVHIQVADDFPRLPATLELFLYRFLQQIMAILQGEERDLPAEIALQRAPGQVIITVWQPGVKAGTEKDDIVIAIAEIIQPFRALGGQVDTEMTTITGCSLRIVLPLGSLLPTQKGSAS